MWLFASDTWGTFYKQYSCIHLSFTPLEFLYYINDLVACSVQWQLQHSVDQASLSFSLRFFKSVFFIVNATVKSCLHRMHSATTDTSQGRVHAASKNWNEKNPFSWQQTAENWLNWGISVLRTMLVGSATRSSFHIYTALQVVGLLPKQLGPPPWRETVRGIAWCLRSLSHIVGPGCVCIRPPYIFNGTSGATPHLALRKKKG